MKVGVVVPCYRPHVKYLPDLLDSIEKQTVKPYKVVISSSSMGDAILTIPPCSFPVELVLFVDRKNAAENRNIATSKLLDCDILSYIDADDIMHPQRIEAIVYAFGQEADIVLHSFSDNPIFEHYDSFPLITNQLARGRTGCAIYIPDECRPGIMHSQVSVRRHIVDQVKFREEPEWEQKEDALFCGDILMCPGIKSQWIPIVLSRYIRAGVWEFKPA